MNQLPGGGLCDDCAGPECEVGGSIPPPPLESIRPAHLFLDPGKHLYSHDGLDFVSVW